MVKNSSTNKTAKRVRNSNKSQDQAQSEPEVVSSTTEVMHKKIKKITKPIETNRIKKNRPVGSSQPEIEKCLEHNSNIEFICKTCLKELCGHCILKHAEHITNICSIRDIVREYVEEGDVLISSPSKLLEESNQIRTRALKEIDEAYNKVTETVMNHFSKINETIKEKYEEAVTTVENFAELREKALQIAESEEDLAKEDIDLVKLYLSYTNKLNYNKPILSPLVVNQDSILTEIQNALTSNFRFDDYDSTASGVPKFLHWFEWGKKKLNVYDIVANVTRIIELDIHNKIPSFSRSIMLPNGLIFLVGGEEPEYVSRKEVYMYDTIANDRKLHSRAPMLHKKFDFTLAHLNGYIYVICGKDSTSEVVDTCERYSVEENVWTQVACVKKKRYAASAVGISNNKVYLFGGRSDYNNSMVHEIEEYCSILNEWSIINVRNINLWTPVEVCACVQIKEDQILIFRGSDAQIKDSTNSLVFNVRDYSFEKMNELKKPQVFVNAPFVYKNHVYALGNEYYMKHRNLHRFSIDRGEWDIIF
jgi:hypothetical protein